MSKATFYEHFANKEECLLALFQYASATLLEALMAASRGADRDYHDRHRSGLRAILESIEKNPTMAQAILVETVGAGPRVAELRDSALAGFAQVMFEETRAAAELSGGPAYGSPDEAFAIVGATFELVSRQLRTGHPERMLDLLPLIERLIIGLLSQPPAAAT
jgi:AcrR family transcriptional regulator